MKRRFFIPLLLTLLAAATLLHSQQLTIQPEAGKQTVLSKSDIEALPHKKITTGAPDSSVTYDVVSLETVLEKAGIDFGKSMTGKRLASCLLVEAADGYRVVIALPELDSAFTDKEIFLAFQKNGKPLDEKEGPYRIVIPEEKRMARWVRQVTTLKIVDVN